MNKRVKAFAPATVANLGIGFDIIGMAVEELGDIVTVTQADKGITVSHISGDGGQLPTDPEKNTAAIAANWVHQQIGAPGGLVIEIEKGLPLASGLGSSAASAVAAAFATNVLFGSPLQTAELLPATLEAEAVVSGRHADNVGPSLLGGILLIAGTEPDDLHVLPVPDNLYVALVTPDVAVPTAQARAVLPAQVPLTRAVEQTRGVSLLIHALYQADIEMLAEAMMSDVLIEPARKHLIPYFDEAKSIALQNGAAGFVISGAGPTLCLISDRVEAVRQAGDMVRDFYIANEIAAALYIGRPSKAGARLIFE